MRLSSQLNFKGDLSTLIRISVPIFLFLFCEALTTFCERIFLSYQATQAVSSALNGTYLAAIFQNPCIAIASMTQVFVGLHQGGEKLKQIGPCVWQLIWFSFLSLVITLPLSFWTSSFYFKGTTIQEGVDYFNLLALGNFLFPLNTALTSFYLGRGKTTLVTSLMLANYALHLLLCWALVFGIEGLVPSLGIQGAALAKCVSLGFFCLVFFGSFLSKKNRALYNTGSWQFSPALLGSYIRPGLIRAFGHFWIKAGWVAISYLMIQKGGEYLDIQTIGGTVVTFLIFIVTGVYRSVLTIAPNLLGSRSYFEVWKLCRSLMIYISIIGVILAIPLLIYPQILSYFFDASSRELFERTFKTINYWIWLYFVALLAQMGLCALVVAARDLKVQFYAYLLTALTSVIPVYVGFQFWGWKPDKLWIIMAMENVILALIFFYHFSQRKWEEKLSIPA